MATSMLIQLIARSGTQRNDESTTSVPRKPMRSTRLRPSQDPQMQNFAPDVKNEASLNLGIYSGEQAREPTRWAGSRPPIWGAGSRLRSGAGSRPGPGPPGRVGPGSGAGPGPGRVRPGRGPVPRPGRGQVPAGARPRRSTNNRKRFCTDPHPERTEKSLGLSMMPDRSMRLVISLMFSGLGHGPCKSTGHWLNEACWNTFLDCSKLGVGNVTSLFARHASTLLGSRGWVATRVSLCK